MMRKIPDESFIDWKYRKHLFDACLYEPEPVNWSGASCYRMECPLCGAAGSHLKWMPHKRTWKFLCSTKNRKNCQVQMELPVLLKTWCPSLFLSYQQERTEAGTAGAGFNCPRIDPQRASRAPVVMPSGSKHQDQTEPIGIST